METMLCYVILSSLFHWFRILTHGVEYLMPIKIVQSLHLFLTQRQLLKTFISLTVKGNTVRNFIDRPCSSIDSAFNWSISSQGHRFWENKSREYETWKEGL